MSRGALSRGYLIPAPSRKVRDPESRIPNPDLTALFLRRL